MEIAIGITTAPRRVPTLPQTLASLAEAGFDPPEIVREDTARPGSAWANWYHTLHHLVQHTAADALMMLQDDVVFCADLAPYLARELWPSSNGIEADVASPYTPTPYNEHGDVPTGWHREDRGHFLATAQCLIFHRATAAALLDNLAYTIPHATKRIDLRVGLWLQDTGRAIYFHKPSLAQHIATQNSALKNDSPHSLRYAADFIGCHAVPPA